jgi:hypothetical protein
MVFVIKDSFGHFHYVILTPSVPRTCPPRPNQSWSEVTLWCWLFIPMTFYKYSNLNLGHPSFHAWVIPALPQNDPMSIPPVYHLVPYGPYHNSKWGGVSVFLRNNIHIDSSPIDGYHFNHRGWWCYNQMSLTHFYWLWGSLILHWVHRSDPKNGEVTFIPMHIYLYHHSSLLNH